MPVLVESFGEDDRLSRRTRFEYDSHGNEILEETTDAEGNVKHRSRHEYHASRDKALWESYFDYAGTSRILFDVQGNRTLWEHYDASGELELRTRYENDLRWNVTLLEEGRDGDGALSFRDRWTYDARGHLILEQKFDSTGTLTNETRYEHDAKGNLTLVESDGLQTRYEYDARGNQILIEETVNGETTSLPIDVTCLAELYERAPKATFRERP